MLSSRAHLHTWGGAILLMVALTLMGASAPEPLTLAMTVAVAYAIAVVGMDVMTGYAGQPNMGQGGFMAIGAYVSTAMMVHYDWGFVPSLLFALLAAAVVAVLLGAGALRLAHIGLAIVSFSFAFVIFMLLNGDLLKQWTGQATGMVVPTASVLGLDFADVRQSFFLALAGLVVTFALTYVYVHSKHGRVLMAIKRSEVLPAVMGVNVFRAKLGALVWSSVVGAFAGVILAQATGFITPESYTANLSITLLAIASIGGLGTLTGPALGAAVYGYLGFVGAGVSGSGLWWPVAFLAVLIFSPAGIYGLLGKLWARARGLVPKGLSDVLGVALGRARNLAPVPGSGQHEPGAAGAPAPTVSAAEVVWTTSSTISTTTSTTVEARPPVLTVQDVVLRYGGVTALSDVSFTVREGTVHALIGPNGAGKTSMLDVLTGVTTPTSGDLRLDGRSLVGIEPYLRTRHGLRRAFQHATLVADLSVFANVQLAAENGGRSWGRDGEASQTVEERTAEALRLAGVDAQMWGRDADELNGGDQKLVDMARAFVGKPRAILLDEPTSGVTEAEIVGIHRAIRSAADAGITVLVIDHNVEFVKSIADHVTVLDFGQVIADGRPGAVLDDPAVVNAFLGGEVEHENAV